MFFWFYVWAGVFSFLSYFTSSLLLLFSLEILFLFLLLSFCLLSSPLGVLFSLSVVVISSTLGLVCFLFSVRFVGAESHAVFLS